MITDTLLDFEAGAHLYLAGGEWIAAARFTRSGCCRIRVFEEHDPEMEVPRTFVLATELDDNPGPSVTTAIEDIAAHVCAAFRIDPFALVLIEHYDNRLQIIDGYVHERMSRENGESFDFVFMPWYGVRFGEPQWQRVSKAEVEEMIGEKLP